MSNKYLLNEDEWKFLRWLSTEKEVPLHLANTLGSYKDVMTNELPLECDEGKAIDEYKAIIEKLRENDLITLEPCVFSTLMTIYGLYSKRTTLKGDEALAEHYNQ